MASINKRGPSWQATVRGPDGREATKSFRRKVDAEGWASTKEAEKARGAWMNPRLGLTPFDEWVEQYMREADKRPTTMARDRAVIRRWLLPTFGSRRIGSITPQDVKRFVEAMKSHGLKPRTVRTNYGVLSAIINAAFDADLIAVSPLRGIRLPPIPKTPGALAEVDDVHRLAAAVPSEFTAAIYLGALGLREAEVFGLRVGAIDFLRRQLTMRETVNEVEGKIVVGDGKTLSSVRTIALPQLAVDALATHLHRTGRTSPDDYVFQAPEGGPIRANNFRQRIYNPALRVTGLEGLTFHRLRHSAGDHMREAGEGLETIQKRLGHASIRTTADIYGSLPKSVDRAAADRLDEMYRGHFADIEVESPPAS